MADIAKFPPTNMTWVAMPPAISKFKVIDCGAPRCFEIILAFN
jgi:hypothetical protein